MNRDLLQKPREIFRLHIGTQGGRPDTDTKENPVLETGGGRSLRGGDAKKGFYVLDESGGEVRIRRRREAVSEI